MRSSFLLTTLAVVCFFCSCSKEDTPATPGKTPEKTATQKHAVEFRLPGFTTNVGEFRKTGTSSAQRDSLLETQIDEVYYFAYDSAGNEVNNIRQMRGELGFGTIKDSLAPGNYTIVLMAQKDTYIWSEATTEHRPLATAGPRLYSNFDGYVLGDLFFKKLSLTVNNADTVVTNNLTLERMVGKLEVNVLDAEPYSPTGHSLFVTASPEITTFGFANGAATIFAASDTMLVPLGEPYLLGRYAKTMLNTEIPFTVTVTDYHYMTNVTTRKVIPNVRCYRNKRTILTGKIFDGEVTNPPATTPGGFKVSINDVWDTDDVNIDF
jgi:hypothetical protein